MAEKISFCYCKTCSEVRIVLEKIYEILKYYDWLLDAYIVDFFYDDLWSRLPSSWQSTLTQLTPRELGCWLADEKYSTKTVLPLSLIALRQVTEILQISRNHNSKLVYQCCSKNSKILSCENEKSECLNVKARKTDFNEKQNKMLLKHIKIKKKYEIEKMGHILSDLSIKTNSISIIDIGAGMGHLSRILAAKYNLNVVRIEQNEALLERAKQWDKELEFTLKKHDSAFVLKKPYNLAVTINASNVLTDLLYEIPKDITSDNGFGIVGLHPCGDLAMNLLRLYNNCDKARFLCIVGCCYMKLTLSNNCADTSGYPLSSFVSKYPCHKLSYNAMEVACHAREKYSDKMKIGDYDDLKVHTFRAVLEYYLVKADIKNRHGQLRSVKLKNNTSFEQYCKLALENTAFQNVPLSNEINSVICLEMLSRWKEVLALGSLRLMLAPLVETAVLLDRYLYLSERNLKPSIKAEFDARISPRNFVLTSYKM